MNSLVTLIALAAAVEVSGAAPVPVSPSPPPVLIAAPSNSPQAAQLPVALEVIVSAGADTLWSGPVRVGGSGANYTQSLRQAVEPCGGRSPAPEIGRGQETQRQLTFTLTRRGGRASPETFGVSVRWTRPISTCEGGGTRSVSIDQEVVIEPGDTVRVVGDANLAVVIRRSR